ncbi:MAG: hypothetical protein U0792_08520 [Gemmataceae bacterium]
MLSGNNRSKIDLMRLAVSDNLNVLADKPWVIEFSDFPKLEELYRETDMRDVIVWDMMTERATRSRTSSCGSSSVTHPSLESGRPALRRNRQPPPKAITS